MSIKKPKLQFYGQPKITKEELWLYVKNNVRIVKQKDMVKRIKKIKK